MTDNILKKLESINDLATDRVQMIDRKRTINHVWLTTFNKPFLTVQEGSDKIEYKSLHYQVMIKLSCRLRSA